ncbi:MAG: hypothetical protein AAB414_00570 [Patescibacteria group bacterium]
MPGPESNPETRQEKAFGGARRGLPNLGARGDQLRDAHLNGGLSPDTPIENLQTYLGVDKPFSGSSRNLRNPHFKLPKTKPGEEITFI